MNQNNVLKKNRRFYLAMFLNVLEGFLSGANFFVLFECIKALWNRNLNTESLLRLTGMLLAVFVIRVIIYSVGYTQGQIGGAQVSRGIRLFLGDKIKKIPLSKFTKGKTGEYINVVTDDVNRYEQILTHKVGDIVKNSALSLLIVLFVSSIYVPAGLIMLMVDLLIFPTLWFSFRVVKMYGNKKMAIMADNVSHIVEYVTGIQTFRAYGTGGTKNKVVTKSMYAHSNISYLYERKMIPVGVTYAIIVGCSLSVMMLVAGNGWIAGYFDAPTFFMLSILPIFAAKIIGVIFVDLTSYRNLMISKSHITTVMNEKEEAESNQSFEPKNYGITFENIVFSYNQVESVLEGISFIAENEKLTAIVGDSGSGKSTIINLIAKYYEPQSGEIKMGEAKIGSINAEKVLSKISMVDQDVFLFNDTIRNNIRHARVTATDDEIREACVLANCDGFIQKLDQGYNTPVGENGNQFSGGERQRLSIARAILKNSEVLLLDEATAALDIENELAVKKAIGNLLKKKKTVIMIAHTLSVIKHADKILVIDGGKVKEEGSHEVLLQNKGKYFDMWQAESQLS